MGNEILFSGFVESPLFQPIITVILAFVGAYVGVRVAVAKLEERVSLMQSQTIPGVVASVEHLRATQEAASAERDRIWTEVSAISRDLARLEGRVHSGEVRNG